MMTKDKQTNSYYADTAYDSRKQYDWIDASENRWTPNRMNGHILKWGVDFGTFLAVSEKAPTDLRRLKQTLNEEVINSPSKFHDYKDNRAKWPQGFIHADHMVVLSRQNWSMVLLLVSVSSGVFAAIWPIAMLLMSYSEEGWGPLLDLDMYLAWSGFALGYFIPRLVLRKGWVKFRVRAIFFRSTGKVYVYPHEGGPAQICHFTEFDGFINSTPNRTGLLYYSLELSHRQKKNLRIPAWMEDTPKKEEIFMNWEFIQQFMDTSKPLPDVPELEPFRHLDPVTAEWDEEHNRPPDLYEKMSDKTFSKYREKLVWDYEKGFQWGRDRWVSEAEGWQPPPEEWWLVPIEGDAEVSAA